MFRSTELKALLIAILFQAQASASRLPLKYAVIGDSYSIGQSVRESERWPNQLVARLAEKNISLQIVSNPSHTGFTTQDALEHELPLFHASHPDFATLQIGVNDWVRGVSPADFKLRFARLLDEMLKDLKDKKNLIVVSIPDFSASPEGAKYGGGRNISRGIKEFNQIIRDECQLRKVWLVDIFALSQKARGHKNLLASDGLHPSGKEYGLWVNLIFPDACKVFNSR